MIPHIVKELGSHGYTITWAILATEETRFFEITKEIHNMIHDHGQLEPFTDRDRKIFERVASSAADVLVPLLKPGDIVLIHDPQPSAIIKFAKDRAPGVSWLWQSHIGLE